ncbi:hypothetical protein I5Q34_19375 [Streptomyces sp. AV19]|uniref:hypothetical protein n=1 Tax=Streptomyces sp. AV19 TaxID=2793068 RepID=UPI0018FE0E4D|nr:hypothetical protein [Streptomyces sp. AV19]MBH1936409.1 hypothetical protein [Streptomyces sp. AV19]MDG4532448.1 hypothetical protein [Streptomyces sp. AV19]
MLYVLLATHSPEVCPTSNASTKELLLRLAPEIPGIAEKSGVTILAGPIVNREHLIIVIVEADTSENVDRFLVESRIPQWNRVHILPSLKMEEVLDEVRELEAIF